MIKLDTSLKVYIETYGCQMNVSDSEVVASILKDAGYVTVHSYGQADLILINTCAIRDNAEQKIRNRLDVFRQEKKKRPQLLIGIIGCMAERLKEKLLEEVKSLDLVAGPDAYRDLPNLLRTAGSGQQAMNVLLSMEETYADISPVRLDKNKVSSFVSIMRGCNNMCAYCIVPYTRGGERSRDAGTILREVQELSDMGYKEVTLLGQNVDSYDWNGVSFAQLLSRVAEINPLLRVRFSTSHPKDMSEEVLHAMARYDNICKSIHLPVQSGSSAVLQRMKREYTREWYLDKIASIRRILPEATLSTDLIAGFCGETEEEHQETLSLMKEVRYDLAFMFKYSERPKTYASRHYKDDIPEEVKGRRLQEIIDLQSIISAEVKKQDLGKTVEVLAEGFSKRSREELFGRTSQNRVVVFPREQYHAGDYVRVLVTGSTPATLLGKVVR
ncbi:MAG: tRNA (N6-isopentenyl adenosine(37)-C2)-methylthiotransferase MiaB [Bacteroidales bacterium]|nr:tRNA (N6-isopentenyl adenosine(37)-C2)-methylthiotransferase MiaB [Bacteroidales bacterium]